MIRCFSWFKNCLCTGPAETSVNEDIGKTLKQKKTPVRQAVKLVPHTLNLAGQGTIAYFSSGKAASTAFDNTFAKIYFVTGATAYRTFARAGQAVKFMGGIEQRSLLRTGLIILVAATSEVSYILPVVNASKEEGSRKWLYFSLALFVGTLEKTKLADIVIKDIFWDGIIKNACSFVKLVFCSSDEYKTRVFFAKELKQYSLNLGKQLERDFLKKAHGKILPSYTSHIARMYGKDEEQMEIKHLKQLQKIIKSNVEIYTSKTGCCATFCDYGLQGVFGVGFAFISLMRIIPALIDTYLSFVEAVSGGWKIPMAILGVGFNFALTVLTIVGGGKRGKKIGNILYKLAKKEFSSPIACKLRSLGVVISLITIGILCIGAGGADFGIIDNVFEKIGGASNWNEVWKIIFYAFAALDLTTDAIFEESKAANCIIKTSAHLSCDIEKREIVVAYEKIAKLNAKLKNKSPLQFMKEYEIEMASLDSEVMPDLTKRGYRAKFCTVHERATTLAALKYIGLYAPRSDYDLDPGKVFDSPVSPQNSGINVEEYEAIEDRGYEDTGECVEVNLE